MEYKRVKVCELINFINSEGFSLCKTIPITRNRAISQFNNPHASPNDIALIIAYKGSNIVGYIGILPASLTIAGINKKVYSNTGWWVDPKHGKSAAMHLFYEMLELYGNSMFFADLTPHTCLILESTGLFNMPKPSIGITGYLKSPLSAVLPKKNKIFQLVKGLLKFSDIVIDVFLFAYYRLQSKSIKLNSEISVSQINELDEQTQRFIATISANTFSFRSSEEFNWIGSYPWLYDKKNGWFNEPDKYYFSSNVECFCNYYFNVFRNNELIAFIHITSRDGNFKLPYFYCYPENSNVLWPVIYSVLKKKKAISFTTWHSEVINPKFRFFMKRKIVKQEAFSKLLLDAVSTHFSLQDGDGDMVFT